MLIGNELLYIFWHFVSKDNALSLNKPLFQIFIDNFFLLKYFFSPWVTLQFKLGINVYNYVIIIYV